MLNERETHELIQAIIDNKEFLQSNETAKSKFIHPNFPNGCLGFMVCEYSYHISIKKISLCVIALVADKITLGLAGKILSALGISLKTINKVNDYTGEKCIIKETLNSDNKLGNVNILDKFNGNCYNNDLNCSFRQGEKCTCSKESIKKIYENLTAREIFQRFNSDYKLNW